MLHVCSFYTLIYSYVIPMPEPDTIPNEPDTYWIDTIAGTWYLWSLLSATYCFYLFRSMTVCFSFLNFRGGEIIQIVCSLSQMEKVPVDFQYCVRVVLVSFCCTMEEKSQLPGVESYLFLMYQACMTKIIQNLFIWAYFYYIFSFPQKNFTNTNLFTE